MIVQCTACQAKFKIADEKVLPKGVKVRCTKCNNTFVVKREEQDASNEPTKVKAFAAGIEATRISRPAAAPGSSAATVPDFRVSGPTAPSAPSAADPFAVPTPAVADPFGGPTPSSSAPIPPAASPTFEVTRRGQPGAGEGAAVPIPAADDAFNDLQGPSDGGNGNGGSESGLELAEPGADSSFDRSAFDMSAATEAPSKGSVLADVPPAPLETASDPAMPSRPPAPSTRVRSEVVSFEPSSGGAADALPGKKQRPARSPLAAAANAFLLLLAGVVALVAVAVFVNGGQFEVAALNPREIVRQLRGTPQRTGLVASEVTNGLYETSSGRPVFYVQGVVSHFGGGRGGPVKVVVEILNPDGAVRKAEAFAGAVPTPEQLYRISQADDLVALQRTLARDAPTLEPGRSAPFAVVFYDYPDDFSEVRLRLHAELGASGPTSADQSRSQRALSATGG